MNPDITGVLPDYVLIISTRNYDSDTNPSLLTITHTHTHTLHGRGLN